jgi:hypothetical protein
MRLTRFQAFAVAVAVVLLAGCGHVIPGSLTGTGKDFAFAKHDCRAGDETDASKVEVRYLGSGGVFIQWQGDAILIGPSFSNHNFLRAGLWRGRDEKERICKAVKKFDYQNVRAILAGHAHYDHIGDFPIVASDTLIPKVPVYVNASGVNILAGEKALQGRLRTIRAYEPINVTNHIVVRPIRSGHAPQFCGRDGFPCRYAFGEVKEPWTTPIGKRKLRAMRGGETFAFDIELLDANGARRYRIYYNDSSASSPLGQTTGDFDLAILTMAQWNRVRDYPRDLLLTLQPRHVLASHWDNFFRKDDENSKFVFRLGAPAFLRVVEQNVPEGTFGPVNEKPVCGVTTSRYTMAVPGSSLLFNPR